MKITSKAGNEYYCRVISWGFTFARPSISVKKTKLHWFSRKKIEYFEQVSCDCPWSRPVTMQEVYLAENDLWIFKWFQDAVEYYEKKLNRDKGIWNYD